MIDTVHSRRQPIEAASNGAMLVEQARARFRIEHRTRQGFEPLGKGGFVEVVNQIASVRVTREGSRELVACRGGAREDGDRSLRSAQRKLIHAGTQGRGVGLLNGERAEAADGTARITGEVSTGASGSIRKNLVDDLNQSYAGLLAILRWHYNIYIMMLKLRAVGTSTGVIFPKDLLTQLNLKEGDELFVVPTREGLLLSPYDAEVAEEVRQGQEFMRKYRNTFHELAK